MALHFELTADNAQLLRKLMETREQIGTTAREADRAGASLEGLFGKASAALGVGLGIEGARQFVSAIVEVRSQIESYEISLNTFLGSADKAKGMMDIFKRVASETTLSVDTLAGGAQTLLGFGIAADKVVPTLMQIGDISGGDAERFRALSLAFAQASSTGKLMGQDLMQMINAGFNPLAQISKDTGKSIGALKDEMSQGRISVEMLESAFRGATSEGGQFYGMLEAQGEGIRGAVNTLSGAWDDMLNEIGQSSSEVIKTGLDTATNLVQHYEAIGEALMVIIGTYGIYRAAIIATTVAERAAAAAKEFHRYQIALATAAGATESAALSLRTKLTYALQTATARLNATIAANPYALVALALVAVTYAIYKVITAQTAQERAQETVNESMERYRQGQEEMRTSMDKYIDTIQDSTATDYQRAKAYAELSKVAPELTAQYDQQALAMMSAEERAKKLNEAQDASEYQHLTDEVAKYTKELERYTDQMRAAASTPYGADAVMYLSRKAGEAREALRLVNERLDEFNRLREEASKTPAQLLIEAKARKEQIDAEFAKVEAMINSFKARNEKIPVYLQILYDKAGNAQAKQSSRIDTLTAQQEQASLTVAQRVAQVRGEIATLTAQISRQRAKDSLATAEDIEATEKALKEARSTLETLTGHKAGKSSDEAKKRARDLAELREIEANHQRERQRALVDAEHTLEGLIIDTIADTGERTRRVEELEHTKRMEAIRRQREDALEAEQDKARARFEKNPSHKGKIFDRSSVQLSTEQTAYYDALEQMELEHQERIKLKRIEQERQTMTEYLREYGTYQLRRQALIDEANAKSAVAATEGERLTIHARLQLDLSTLDTEANKASQIVSRIFASTTEMTSRQMRALADEAEQMMRYLAEGVHRTDAGGAGLFGITAEQYEQLSKSPDKLKAISDQIIAVRREADGADSAFGKIGSGIKALFSKGGTNPQALTNALALIREGVGEIQQGVSSLSGTFSSLAEATGSGIFSDISQGLDMASDAMNSAMQGMQAGMMLGGPIGAVAGAAIGAISSVAKSLGQMYDKKHEERIKAMALQIEKLDKSYAKLDKAIGKAYSHDVANMIAQQETLLKQKQRLLQAQIAEERSKKKSDPDKIRQMQAEYDSIFGQIDDNRQKAIDAIFGQDIKGAIDDFASAYADAWTAGNDRAEASRAFVRKQIRMMIMETIKQTSSKPIEELRKRLDAAWSDNVITAAEEQSIERLSTELRQALDKKIEPVKRWLEDDKSSEIAGSRGGFETMSQDTGRELSGRFASIQQYMLALVEGAREQFIVLEDLRNISLLSSQHLERIAAHTKHLGEMNERLGNIERNTKHLR